MTRKKASALFIWLIALTLLGVMGYSYFAFRGQSRYIVQPNRTRIVIHGSEASFLDKDDVSRILPIDITDTTTVSVDLAGIEGRVRQEIPYAKKVNAYISPAAHQMTVQVESRKPVLRFFSDQGSFYLDDEGNPMRTKVGVSVYLPIVRAHQVDSITLKQTLLPLSQFMQTHEDWASFFSVIELKEGNRLHFYPRVGDYIFEVLGTTNLEEDLEKIHTFYNKIVPQVGANRYQLVKLSYSGQIVCKRRP